MWITLRSKTINLNTDIWNPISAPSVQNSELYLMWTHITIFYTTWFVLQRQVTRRQSQCFTSHKSKIWLVHFQRMLIKNNRDIQTLNYKQQLHRQQWELLDFTSLNFFFFLSSCCSKAYPYQFSQWTEFLRIPQQNKIRAPDKDNNVQII